MQLLVSRFRTLGLTDELADASVKELVITHAEEDWARYVAFQVETGSGVPAAPEEKRAEQEVRELGRDFTETEDLPAVKLGFLLSCFEDVSVGDKLGLDLDNDAGSNEGELEEREDSVLQVTEGLAREQEGYLPD